MNLSEGRWFRGTVVNVSEHYTTVIVTDTGTVDERIGAHRICSNDRIQEDAEPPKGWVSFMVRVPAEDMARMHTALETLGFQETDWCAYSRPQDEAWASYGPCEGPSV